MKISKSHLKQMIDEAVLGLVGKKTAIGDAIALAVKRFDEKKESNRVLVLLTDGQRVPEDIHPASPGVIASMIITEERVGESINGT